MRGETGIHVACLLRGRMMTGLHVMMGKKEEVAATMERLLAATIQVRALFPREMLPDRAWRASLSRCLKSTGPTGQG